MAEPPPKAITPSNAFFRKNFTAFIQFSKFGLLPKSLKTDLGENSESRFSRFLLPGDVTIAGEKIPNSLILTIGNEQQNEHFIQTIGNILR